MQGWSAPRPALKRNSFLLVGRINRPAMSGNWASLLNWRVRQTVVDQKRCAFRRKDCSPPEDGDLERHHGIERRATAFYTLEIADGTVIRTNGYDFEITARILKINGMAEIRAFERDANPPRPPKPPLSQATPVASFRYRPGN